MSEEKNIAPKNEKLNVVKYETEDIKKLIYTVRGKQVMLDSDVAMLYHYETKYINLAVRRNIERFPDDFCIQLSKEEFLNLRLHFATLKVSRKYLPYVFTEQGIAMISGLLKNETAINVSINIMNAFVEMRRFINLNGHIFERLTNVEYKLLEYDKKFDTVFNELQKDKEKEFTQKIFLMDRYMMLIV